MILEITLNSMDNYAMSAYAEIGRSSLDEGAWAECLLSAISGHSAIPCTLLYEYCYISISMSSPVTRTL